MESLAFIGHSTCACKDYWCECPLLHFQNPPAVLLLIIINIIIIIIIIVIIFIIIIIITAVFGVVVAVEHC